MNLNTFLQAVISLVFIYLILSLLTSEFQEYLATFSEARAKRLKQSIRQMLGEEDWLNGYFIDGNDIKTYSPDYVITENSMVWLSLNSEEPTTAKVVFDENDNNLKFTWIDTSNNTELTEEELIVSSDSEKAGKTIDANLTKFEVYPDPSSSNSYAWKRDGILTPVKDKNNLVYNGDGTQCFIWIDGNSSQEINLSEVIPVPSDPAVPSDPVKGAKINTKLTKYPLYQVLIELKKDTKYYINRKNQRIVPLDSLTEKLYEHPNIVALNQSAFRWFWILGISFDYPCKKPLNEWESQNISNLISTILLICSIVVSLIFTPIPWGIIFLIAFTISRILGLRVSKAKKGKVGSRRESVGPSYIDDSELFAETLIDVIYGNSTITYEELDNSKLQEILNSLKFYTPASSRLVERLQKSANIINVGTFITDIKTQYEEVQKRSAGVYKRNAKGLSFLVGLLIAISFNADTLNMISNLTNGSNKFPEQLYSQLQKNPELIKDPTKQTELKEFFNNSDSLPLGWDYDEKLKLQQAGENQEKAKNLRALITVLKGDNDTIQTLCNAPETNKECFNKVKNLLLDQNNSAIIPNLDDDFKSKFTEDNPVESEKLSLFVKSYNDFLKGKEKELINLVFGTSPGNVDPTSITSLTETLNNGKAIVEQKQGGWLKASLGWLITAIALSMGAPFWFDQLSRIMNVRNSAKPKDQEQNDNP